MACENLSDQLRGVASVTRPPYLDKARVSNNRLELDSVNQRLSQGDILDAGVVEAINIVPDYDSIMSTELDRR